MPSIHEVKGVGPTMAAALSEKGILTPEQLAETHVDDLVLVEGVGPARAAMLIDAAKEAVATSAVVPDQVAEPAPETAEERTTAHPMVNGKPPSDDKSESEAPTEDPIAAVQEKIEETSQIAAEISNGLKVTESRLAETKKAKAGKSKEAGEKKKPKKAKKAKNGKTIKALKKEVKKRRSALKRQKQKLKQARKALKAIA